MDDKSLALLSLLEIIGHVWSISIIVIYLISAFLFYKLYKKVKDIGQYGWGTKYVIFVCISMALAFSINLVITLRHGGITVSTIYVVAVIRPLIFLVGTALSALANAAIFEFKHRGG